MANASGGPSITVNPVAATQVGVSPTDATRLAARSQYLAEALRAMADSGAQPIRGGLGEVGAKLLASAILMHGKQKADQQSALITQQIAQRLYPNDPNAQLRWMVDPSGMNAAAAKAYEPMAVKQGESVGSVNSGFHYTAPVMWHDANLFGTQTPTGVTTTGERGPTIPEQNTQTAQAEQARHNQVLENLQFQELPFKLAMARAALSNAATSAGNLGLNTAKTPEVSVPQGYVLDQAPGR